MDEAKSVAQQMGESLKPQAQEAMESVKDTAATGAEHVKAEGEDLTVLAGSRSGHG